MIGIKLRAWTGSKMIYRGLHDRNWYTEMKGGRVVKGAHPSDKDQLKIMQFTGLKDRNGVEIYEGDKVHFDGTPYNVNALKTDGIVVNYKGSWAIKYQSKYTKELHSSYYLFSCEDFVGKKSKVIGNIHDKTKTT